MKFRLLTLAVVFASAVLLPTRQTAHRIYRRGLPVRVRIARPVVVRRSILWTLNNVCQSEYRNRTTRPHPLRGSSSDDCHTGLCLVTRLGYRIAEHSWNADSVTDHCNFLSPKRTASQARA